MNIVFSLLCIAGFLLYAPVNSSAQAHFTGVYVDSNRNIYAVLRSGKSIPLTKDGKNADPKLANDGRTIGWLVLTRMTEPGGQAGEVAETLILFRDSHILQRLSPGGFIRNWRFWNRGKQVVLYFGGLHFAGTYGLFETRSGKQLKLAEDSVQETSPAWVKALR